MSQLGFQKISGLLRLVCIWQFHWSKFKSFVVGEKMKAEGRELTFGMKADVFHMIADMLDKTGTAICA